MPHLSKEELAAFLPHGGKMCLIDRVEGWDETRIRCQAGSHRDATNPLRQGVCLEAIAGLEYAAQAMGVHVGLVDQGRSPRGSIGYVGSMRDVVFGVDRLDDCMAALTIDAVRLLADDDRYLYRFAISCGDRELMSGRASIFLKQART